MVSPLSRNTQNPFGWGFGRVGGHEGGCRQADGTKTLQRLLAVQRTNESGIELQIQTDEGDTVTISLHDETSMTAISYRTKSRGPEGRESLRLKANQITSTQEMSVTVEGSLNEAELADVKELMDRVKSAVESFFAGGGEEEALALASTDGESLESLAGFRLDLERSETVTAIALRMREWKPASQALPASPVATGPTAAPEPLPAALAPAEAPAAPEAEPEAQPLMASTRPAAPDVSWILRLLEDAAAKKNTLLA